METVIIDKNIKGDNEEITNNFSMECNTTKGKLFAKFVNVNKEKNKISSRILLMDLRGRLDLIL